MYRYPGEAIGIIIMYSKSFRTIAHGLITGQKVATAYLSPPLTVQSDQQPN